MKSKDYSKIAWFLITLIFLGLFVYILGKNYGEVSKLFGKPLTIFFLFLFSCLALLLNGMKIKIIIKAFGVNLKLKEAYWLAVITQLGNYFTPFRGGAALRALYLKKKYQFRYTDFVATMGGTYIIVFFVISILGILSSLVLYGMNVPVPKEFIILFVSILCFTFLIIIIKIPYNEKSHNFFLRNVSKVVVGWHKIKKDKKLMLKLFMIDTLIFFIIMIKIFLIFDALDAPISLIYSFILGLIHGISMLITITPASLGIRESAIAFSSNLLGANFNMGILVSIIERAFVILTMLFFALVFGKKYLKKRSQNI